ncbi:MAG: DUF2889 domain-containing protein [Novosphingobium sp.]|nr:DUF2889 domain-containing protein [Novosphingobium sp.]MCP5402172.1 DUF2889 domain-containing protein [Novosphingobium sp.]
MATTTLPPPPRKTANPAPVRPGLSIRRTCSIDVSWPQGETGDRLFVGRARDYLTPAGGGAGKVLDQAEYRATLAQDKTITSVSAEPAPPKLDQLVGVRGGNHLRLFIKEVMPELISEGMPIYLVLDDISGTALVSAFAWSQWHDDWAERLRDRMEPGEFERLMSDRVNICWGLQEGNSGVSPDGPSRNVAEADAGELRNPADPEGWHAFPESDGPGFRRARRIDVSRDEASGLIRIDAAFQDSAKRKDGGRVAIHEYCLSATADLASGELLSIEPEARILPFSECPGAVHNTQRLIGSRLPAIRDEVLAQLRGPEGCTHLNDALRALADVPKLADYLAQDA